MAGLNREAVLRLVAELQAKAAAAKAQEVVLSPEQQRQKELDDAYRRGYEAGRASSHSWRL